VKNGNKVVGLLDRCKLDNAFDFSCQDLSLSSDKA